MSQIYYWTKKQKLIVRKNVSIFSILEPASINNETYD